MNRRSFLKAASAGALGMGAGVGDLLWRERQARAFGEVPAGAASSMVPPELRAQSILEVFLYGGVSQYESFCCMPDDGASEGAGWSLFLKSGDVQAALDTCGVHGPLTAPFAPDGNGRMVHFGPFAMPLRNRPDVMARTRVAITAHNLPPHEGAIPLALGGRNLGDPSLAGLGSHIQRYFMDRNPTAGHSPFSYVLRPQSPGFPTDNISSATAIGFHPAAARPLSVEIDAAGNLDAMLARAAVGPNRGAYDAAMQHYVDAYGAGLKWRGQGEPTRSPQLTNLASAASAVANSDAVRQVLASQWLTPLRGSECGDTNLDATAMSLRLAAHLLTNPASPARYVCVIDGGLVMADGGGGYDSHFENSHTQARNLSHMLKALMGIINEPGESDPTKLDLDRTMILLTTEFGRAPTAQDGAKGRNHWPYGYPITFIGGPVRSSGVFGACAPNFVATLAASPQENRIAALLALGIWPFDAESYGVSDVPSATTATQAAQLVVQRQLGLATT